MVNRAQLSCLSITLSISVACFFYILYRAPPTYPLVVLIHLRVFAVFGNLTNSLWLCMWKQNLAIVSCRCVWLRELVYVCVWESSFRKRKLMRILSLAFFFALRLLRFGFLLHSFVRCSTLFMTFHMQNACHIRISAPSCCCSCSQACHGLIHMVDPSLHTHTPTHTLTHN